MNQELEQRVNQLVLENNGMSHADALRQVQTELAEEEVKKKENGDESTDSDSSDGQFQYVEPVETPQMGVTGQDKLFSRISPLGTTAEEASVRRYNREVDQYNNDPQSSFGLDRQRYRDESSIQFGLLVNKLSREGADREGLLSEFQDVTGIQLDDDIIASVDEAVNETINRQEAFEDAEKKAREQADSIGDFEPLRLFYEQEGIDEENINETYRQWERGQTISEAYQFSTTVDEFNGIIDGLAIEPEQAETLKNDFKESYDERGENLFSNSNSRSEEVRVKLRESRSRMRDIEKSFGDRWDLLKSSEEFLGGGLGTTLKFSGILSGVTFAAEQALGETISKEEERMLQEYFLLEQQLEDLENQRKETRRNNRNLNGMISKHPELKGVMSMIAFYRQKYLKNLPKEVLQQYYDGKLTFNEAIAAGYNEDYVKRLSYQENIKKSDSEYRGEGRGGIVGASAFADGGVEGLVQLLPEIEIPSAGGDVLEERFASTYFGDIESLGSVNLTQEEVNQVLAQSKEDLRDFAKEVVSKTDMTEDEVKAFEELMMFYSGVPLSLDGDEWVGSGLRFNPSIAIGGIVDLAATVASAPQHLEDYGNYLVDMSEAKTEEEKKRVEEYWNNQSDLTEARFDAGAGDYFRNLGAQADLGKDWIDSMEESNWGFSTSSSGSFLAGLAKFGNAVAEMAPDTIAAAALTVASGGSALPSLALFYTASMVRNYNEFRGQDWYNDMNGIQRSLLLNSNSLSEALFEAAGGKVTLRLVNPMVRRSLGETGRSVFKRRAKAFFVDTGVETGFELANSFWQNTGLYLADQRENIMTGRELLETTALTLGMSGSAAGVGKIKSTTQAAFSSGTDINSIGMADYFASQWVQVMDQTEAGSLAREQAINSIIEEMGVVGALQSDSFELHEYINTMSESDGARLSDISQKLFETLKGAELATSPSERETLRLEAEKLVQERLNIENNYADAFFQVNGGLASPESIDNLTKRAQMFEAQAEKLRKAGKESQADSMLARANRVKEAVRVSEQYVYVSDMLAQEEVISSENRKPEEIAKIIKESQVGELLVDEKIAEELKKLGFSEVQYKGNESAKLMVDGRSDFGSAELTLDQARQEARDRDFLDKGRGSLEDRTTALLAQRLRESGGAENLTEYQNSLLNSLSKEQQDRAIEVSQRTLEDANVDPAAVPEDVELSADAKSTFDVVSKKLSGLLSGYNVVVADEKFIFAQDVKRIQDRIDKRVNELEASGMTEMGMDMDFQLNRLRSELERVQNGYLNGTTVMSGGFDGKTITITKDATAKDVVEEFAHAFIYETLVSVDEQGNVISNKSEVGFRKALESILKSDPSLRQAIQAKEKHYSENLGFKGVRLQEELLVEAIAIMATTPPATVLSKTKAALNDLINGRVPNFTSSGGDVFNVFKKLADTLVNEDVSEGELKETIEQALSVTQEELAERDEVDAQDPNVDQRSSYRRPSFLDQKTVTFNTIAVSKYTGLSSVTGTQQRKFNDYYHFANWYRKMTGNGQFSRIGSMSYVDDNGVVRTLKPPRPLMDKNTGEPVRMEPAMKSFDQRMIDVNTRRAEEAKERRMRGALASNAITKIASRIEPIISQAATEARGRYVSIPVGNVSKMIGELMSDFTLDGTPNESVLDENGQPILEKVVGSQEYYVALQERVNEMMTDNYDSGTIFYSSRQLDFLLKSELNSDQKKKNFKTVFELVKDNLDSTVAAQMELFIKSNNPIVPPIFAQQLYHSYMITQSLNDAETEIKPGDRKILTRPQRKKMAALCARELDAVNTFLGNRAKRFYKVFAETGLSRQDEDGKWTDGVGIKQAALTTDENGNLVGNEEKLELARKHQDLYVALIGVLSNGNRAVPNLTEATKLYNVILEDIMRDGGIGQRTNNRLNKIENSNSVKGISSNRPKEISTGLRVILGLQENKKYGKPYNFEKPGEFKANFLKKGKKGIVGQESYGSWKKIGAFIANLYQDFSILTQDRHLVNYIDARIRPGTFNRFSSKSFRDFLYSKDENGERIWSDSEIKKIRKEVTAEGKIYDMAKAKAWVARHLASKVKGGEPLTKLNEKKKQALKDYYENSIRLKGKASGSEAEMNREFVEMVREEMIALKGGMHQGITTGQVMQIMFAANHILPNAVGVTGRTYDDFGSDTWEKVVENTSSVNDYFLNEQQELEQEYDSYVKSEKIEKAFGEELSEAKVQAYRDRMIGESTTMSDDVAYYSSRSIQSLSDHNQFGVHNVSKLFQGRQVSTMSKVKFGVAGFNLNKLLEGRGSEAEIKGKVSSFGKAEDTFVEGVVFMRHPLYADSFVDSYGNRIKYADNAIVSGDALIAYGNVRYAEPVSQAYNGVVDVSKPEHFVAFQNFVSILKQRNPSLQNSPAEMFEMAYSEMSNKQRARFANLTVDEHGNVIKGRRLRGTSKRVASSSEYGKFKAEIINNPNNYIDRQKIADEKKALEEMSPQELVSLMRGEALNNLATRNDDVGVLAGIELINRLQAEGNDIGIVSVLDQLAAVGTTAGRVLRHMAELKTSSPQGMASVIIKKAESQGKILSEAQKKEILDATKEYMRAYRMAEDFMERGIAGEDVENLFKRAQEDLSNAERDLDTLANKYVEKSWAEIGQQLVQGNLLTMMSQARNVVYNVANIIPKTIVDIMSMPTSKAFELLGLHKEQRKLSLAGYLYAMRKFGAGTVEAMEQVITGREKDLSEWRMSRGFMPIRSLMHAMSTDLPEGQTLRDEFNQRAKLLVQGTFGIPAEAMFRLLSLGDVPFRRFAEGLELYNVGRGKGLEGEALAQFLKFPDKDSADLAATEGRKLTFQEPMGLARGSMWIIDNISRGMGQAFKNVKGFNGEGFFKFLIRLNVPYVSTIANFTEETLTYASPVFGGGKMAIQMGNGEYTEASKTLTKVMVGQAVSTSALYLISQGLLSGSVDWEDDEKTNLMYDTFPPNSINVSGLRRLMNGEDPSPQAGDEFRSYQTLGVFGTIMGAYAHSTTPEAAKEMAEQPFSSNNALKKLFGFENVSVVAYMMDQSFLQGLNGITSVIASTSDPDDFERAFFKYVETISKAFSSMFLPNVLSGVDQATREFLPDKRDKDLADRIKNHVRERTFNTGGLPVKVNWKGERIEQAPVGGNQFAYYMFDATKKKEASQDEVSLNILNLYLDTGVLTKAVGTPYYASSVYRKLRPPSVSRGKAKKAYAALGTTYQFIENPQEDFFVRLTAEEINNALEMTNTLRYNDIQAFMQTEDYKGMSNNEKIEALDEINDRYKSLLSYNPDGSFMEHSKYILGIMERRYLEQYGQN